MSKLLAQGLTVNDTGLGTTANSAGYGAATSLPQVLGTVLQTALGLIGFVVFWFILYSGFMWMTAGGNAEQVEKAKAMLRNAVIGFLIITGAYALTAAVINGITTGSVTGTPTVTQEP